MESTGEQTTPYQPPSIVLTQLLLLSAAIALQIVAIIILVKVLLHRRRHTGQERQHVAEERQGLTAGAVDLRSSVDNRDNKTDSDHLSGRAEDNLDGSGWLAPRYRVVCGCCFGGFICCTSSVSTASLNTYAC